MQIHLYSHWFVLLPSDTDRHPDSLFTWDIDLPGDLSTRQFVGNFDHISSEIVLIQRDVTTTIDQLRDEVLLIPLRRGQPPLGIK